MATNKVETMEVDEVVQHSPDKVWKAYVHELDQSLPLLMPGHFDTVTHLGGPPLSVGSIAMLSYHQDIKHYDFVKLRWDEMNHEEHRFKCTLVEGGALNKNFSHLAYNFSILPGPNANSCVMHFTIEFVDIGDHTFHDFIKTELQSYCKTLDSHLLNVV